MLLRWLVLWRLVLRLVVQQWLVVQPWLVVRPVVLHVLVPRLEALQQRLLYQWRLVRQQRPVVLQHQRLPWALGALRRTHTPPAGVFGRARPRRRR